MVRSSTFSNMEKLTFNSVAEHLGIDPESLVDQYYQSRAGIVWKEKLSDEDKEAMLQAWLRNRMGGNEIHH